MCYNDLLRITTMSAITFDAIKYVDELLDSGFNEPQAKAQVKILQV